MEVAKSKTMYGAAASVGRRAVEREREEKAREERRGELGVLAARL
jgi:hypothetical protein